MNRATIVLGGWTRIGIVLCALWAAGCVLTAGYEYFADRALFSDFAFTKIVDDGPPVGQYIPIRFEPDVKRLALVVLVPIIAFWAVSLLIWRTAVWVKAGFTQ